MRWLLITTRPESNPGDQFIRIGVERLVRAVDPRPEFDILWKDDGENLGRRRPFDRAILCGMPLWWNNPTSTCETVGWWGELLRGWPSEDRRRFLILGAGPANGVEGKDPDAYFEAIKWTIGRAWAVTSRNTVIDLPQIMDSICPAAFAVERSAERDPGLRLINLMPAGAHDAHFNPEQARRWGILLPAVAAWAKARGFRAIAHSDDELALAEALGFREVFRFTSMEDYLAAYNACSIYVGNLLHGALAAAASGAKACAIGYDSRIRMLDRFGVLQLLPSEADPAALEAFRQCRHAPDLVFAMIQNEFARNLALLRRFASGG